MVSAPLRELSRRVKSDPNVVGLVLTGSQAREGMATERSDVDVYVVVARPDERWKTTRSKEIDIPVCTLDQLRHVPGPDEPDGWWARYSFTHTRILLDRSDDELERLVNAWGSLSGAESKSVLESHLDGYINWAYRSLKSHCDGRDLESKLDATESLPWALTVIFALHKRVRPYNKYLSWELANHPLEGEGWDGERLLDLLTRIVTDGDPGAQRDLFALIENDARTVGLGGIVDGWGDELAIFRSR